MTIAIREYDLRDGAMVPVPFAGEWTSVEDARAWMHSEVATAVAAEREKIAQELDAGYRVYESGREPYQQTFPAAAAFVRCGGKP